ncbi:MAG: ABC transporter permease [Melioribacteraceae bacterium]|nr:ABC transporter permease [Melioribacteraceae bacterium]MCF8356638.1 ABC transporter permease [Melioribacteraceae bacterium]MCF8396016.1 ABC transporter permease [Melioribacteraceae bacterium]MCF8421047.1 ABC transporter permease [Melioribacteraceae bacterium]
MLYNYIKSAFRNINRNRTSSLINILGLAVGLSVVFCIIIYIAHELNFDKQHENYNKIYRIDSEWRENEWRIPLTGLPLAPEAKNQIPGIINYTRLMRWNEPRISVDDREIVSKNMFFADTTLFDIFTFHFLYGNPHNALKEINSVILSEDLAIRWFGRKNIVGEILNVKLDSSSIDVQVTGVLRKETNPGSIKPGVIFPLGFATTHSSFFDPADWAPIQRVMSYLLLEDPADMKSIERKLADLYMKHNKDTEHNVMRITFHVVPLSDTYYVFDENTTAFSLPVINPKKIIVYGAIAALVLLLGLVNFILLNLARISKRNLAVGIRKVIGANQKDIAYQMIVESTINSILSFPLSLILIEILFPFFTEIINREIDVLFYKSFWFISGAFAITIILGLLTGLITVLMFYRINPKIIIDRNNGWEIKKLKAKRFLIGFQMIVFISLITSALILKSQLSLTHNIEMGYDTENFLVIHCSGLKGKEKVFKSELQNNTGIIDLAFTHSCFPYIRGNRFEVSVVDNPEDKISFAVPIVGYDYPDLIDLKLLAGKLPTEQNYKGKVLITETGAKALNLNSPVGNTITISKLMKREIMGVVKDFHFNSLRDKIRPAAILINNSNYRLVVKYDPAHLASVVESVKKAWYKLSSEPVDITFLDDKIDNMYSEEFRFSKAIDFFAFIAVLISCMGLFGMILFSTEQRIKEVGIRKVLGASGFSIVVLFFFEIFIILILASCISGIISYYFMNKWLMNFAYRIDIEFWHFIVSSLAATFVSIGTVLLIILRVASKNPVDSIKYE